MESITQSEVQTKNNFRFITLFFLGYEVVKQDSYQARNGDKIITAPTLTQLYNLILGRDEWNETLVFDITDINIPAYLDRLIKL
jgi:hypothetical protein